MRLGLVAFVVLAGCDPAGGAEGVVVESGSAKPIAGANVELSCPTSGASPARRWS